MSSENEITDLKMYLKIKMLIPVFDRILTEMNERFSTNKEIFEGISCFNPKFKDKFLNFVNIVPLAKHYNCDLNLLESEFKILARTVDNYEKENNIKVETVIQFSDLLLKYKLAFAETNKLCEICLTIPVSSAGCERSFSCLRRIKNYMRNSMTDPRLSHLASLTILF